MYGKVQYVNDKFLVKKVRLKLVSHRFPLVPTVVRFEMKLVEIDCQRLHPKMMDELSYSTLPTQGG